MEVSRSSVARSTTHHDISVMMKNDKKPGGKFYGL